MIQLEPHVDCSVELCGRLKRREDGVQAEYTARRREAGLVLQRVALPVSLWRARLRNRRQTVCFCRTNDGTLHGRNDSPKDGEEKEQYCTDNNKNGCKLGIKGKA
jgi:hypothetical protein